MMNFLFGRIRAPQAQVAADALHDAVIAALRQPAFFTVAGVSDTFMGRFELLVLLTSPVLRRLRQGGPEVEQVAQRLVDTMFRRLDIAMRELGVGDITVPKKMKRLAEAYGGRSSAYDQALEARDEAGLAAAIARNVLDGRTSGHDLAGFIMQVDEKLRSVAMAQLLLGTLVYPSPDFAHVTAEQPR